MKPAKPNRVRVTSAEVALVQIEKPVYGGAFLARVEGKAVFVPLTLPGEQARVRMVEEKRGYANAEIEEVVVSSPQRIEPRCPHFGACGGCHYQHTDYATQLLLKQTILRETLARGGVAAPEEIHVLAGEPWGYRNRIRLAFDIVGNVGYRGRRSHAIIPIRECPIAAPLLVRAGLAAAEAMRKAISAQRSGAQPSVEISLFCNPDGTALLASLSYAAPAKLQFDAFRQALAAQVPEMTGAELVLEGRDGQPQRTVAQWGAASLAYLASGFNYRVDQGAFFQVNRWLVNALVDRVTAGRSGALAWDLFAGVGLFALQLAANFARVVAVESAPAAVTALEENLRGTNGQGVRAETLDFLRGGTQKERPDLIVVDPPRIGLGAEVTTLLSRVGAPSLIYVSCDPATLARDLKALVASGYAIESITLADLFPQTFHLETVVHLRRS